MPSLERGETVALANFGDESLSTLFFELQGVCSVLNVSVCAVKQRNRPRPAYHHAHLANE